MRALLLVFLVGCAQVGNIATTSARLECEKFWPLGTTRTEIDHCLGQPWWEENIPAEGLAKATYRIPMSGAQLQLYDFINSGHREVLFYYQQDEHGEWRLVAR